MPKCNRCGDTFATPADYRSCRCFANSSEPTRPKQYRTGDGLAGRLAWFGTGNCGACGDLRAILNTKPPAWIRTNRDRLLGWLERSAADKGATTTPAELAAALDAELAAALAADSSPPASPRPAELGPGPFTAVWVYWHGGAYADEIRYSIRSAERNLGDLLNVVICGDRPQWYDGAHIPSPRFRPADALRQFGTARWCKEVDSIVKLERIIASELVTSDFLWLYDDTFIVKPTTIAAIAQPRAGGLLHAGDLNTAPRHKWREALQRTARALVAAGYPQRNYSTHYPVVYNKAKLRETFAAFDPHHRPRCIESLYLNHHANGDPLPINPVFQYTKQPLGNWKPRRGVSVVNVGGFNTAAQREIKALGHPPASVENAAV